MNCFSQVDTMKPVVLIILKDVMLSANGFQQKRNSTQYVTG